MTRLALTYLATLATMIVLDGLFLGLVGAAQFRTVLGDLMLTRPRLAPAILFYLLYPLGVLIFATLAVPPGRWSEAIWRGALFGFFAYATYDLTNYATLRPWALRLVVMDLVWGSLLSAAAAYVGYWVSTALSR